MLLFSQLLISEDFEGGVEGKEERNNAKPLYTIYHKQLGNMIGMRATRQEAFVIAQRRLKHCLPLEAEQNVAH
jgi:hypothetical protein